MPWLKMLRVLRTGVYVLLALNFRLCLRRVIGIDIYGSITESEAFRKDDTRRRLARDLIRKHFTVPG
jgi:hypothetical protein